MHVKLFMKECKEGEVKITSQLLKILLFSQLKIKIVLYYHIIKELLKVELNKSPFTVTKVWTKKLKIMSYLHVQYWGLRFLDK